MPIDQRVRRRDSVCLAGGSVEPVVPAKKLLAALDGEDIEQYRPLLPVGYAAVARAYAEAAAGLTADSLSQHYTTGLSWFHSEFVPQLISRLSALTGGVWSQTMFGDYIAFAAGSDVDLMAHLIEAVAMKEPVVLFPGDWFGFSVGSICQDNIVWRIDATNRHLTREMLDFLDSAETCLLNLNLYPTLANAERAAVARSLLPVFERSVLSISFSRGFGMTASQLGVFLVHRDHPYAQRFREQWTWFTYFYNAIAAQAFLRIDLDVLQTIDARRRNEIAQWLEERGLPSITTGSYYVKSFTVQDEVPEMLRPIYRDGLVRMCFKPQEV
jgi:hypothetical protein